MIDQKPTPDDGPVDPRTVCLPLTEARESEEVGTDEALIQTVVESFYGTIREDDVLGPIFMARIVDWTPHLLKMRDFWSTIVLRTGRYAGRPLDVHGRIPDLDKAHFHRWIQLWKATVERHVSPNERHRFIDPAVRMAYSISQHRDRQAKRGAAGASGPAGGS